MTVLFVPTLYYKNEWTGIINSIVVGLFGNEEDAMKSLIGKLIEEDYIYFENFCEDHDEDDQYTKDEFIDMVYTKFKASEDENKNFNQNLHQFMNHNMSGISLYIHDDFGQKWGCKIEVHSPFNEKPVMK